MKIAVVANQIWDFAIMMEISSSEYFEILISLKKIKPMIHCQNFCSDYISEKIRRQLKRGWV